MQDIKKSMRIDIITLFPSMFTGPFAVSMLKKAQDKGLVQINFIDLRQFGLGSRRQVDDTPYGGGDGMLLKPEPIVAAIEAAGNLKVESRKSKDVKTSRSKIILLTPQGKTYSQPMAKKLAKEEHLILICGHYEGFDERIRTYVDMEVSIGDYVLTGGEIPAMVLVDSIARLIPGVLGGENSAHEESFSQGKTLEYPQYTRPVEFIGMKVPDILLTGNHGEIKKWRHTQSRSRLKK
jgi:tRNA (guanine37-N1)-methyltransferase